MIEYRKGDATQPVGDGMKIIAHIVNNAGKWGAGFVLALSKRWRQPEAMYRHLFSGETGVDKPRLGDIHITNVKDGIFVVNMVAQNGLPSRSNPVPCDLSALKNCLMTLKHRLDDKKVKASIHIPAIGTGFGGRDWSEVEPIIHSTIAIKYKVTVYMP